MRADEIAARYQRPEKTATRQFVVDLALASGCKTALDLWGGGSSARALAAAGLTVTSAESNPLWADALATDATAFGYEPHPGRAERAAGSFDMVWFDSCSQASRQLARELSAVAKKARRWLVVTLMPERETDKDIVMARTATIPAWLEVTTGLGLDYITRYIRNGYNQEMWLAVLSPRQEVGRVQLHPLIVDRNLRHAHRRYWASNDFRKQYGSLLPYVSNLQGLPLQPRTCAECRVAFTPRINGRAKWCQKPDCKRARNRFYAKKQRKKKRVILPKRRCGWCNRLFTPQRKDAVRGCPGTNHGALYGARLWAERHPERASESKRLYRVRNTVPRLPRVCQSCTEVFTPRTGRQEYCGAPECQMESRRASSRAYMRRKRRLLKAA